jgi:hypothetical protein
MLITAPSALNNPVTDSQSEDEIWPTFESRCKGFSVSEAPGASVSRGR